MASIPFSWSRRLCHACAFSRAPRRVRSARPCRPVPSGDSRAGGICLRRPFGARGRLGVGSRVRTVRSRRMPRTVTSTETASPTSLSRSSPAALQGHRHRRPRRRRHPVVERGHLLRHRHVCGFLAQTRMMTASPITRSSWCAGRIPARTARKTPTATTSATGLSSSSAATAPARPASKTTTATAWQTRPSLQACVKDTTGLALTGFGIAGILAVIAAALVGLGVLLRIRRRNAAAATAMLLAAGDAELVGSNL